MSDEHHDHDGKFIAGLLFGALIGAAAGILFAPKSGEETRAILKQKSKKWIEEGKDIIKEKKEETKEKVKEAIDKALT